MSIRRSIATALVAALTLGTVPGLIAAQDQTTPAGTPVAGTIAGKATDEAKKPYADYSVQLRDPATGQVVTSVTLDPQGMFSFTGLSLDKKYSVELLKIKDNKILCTEGPYPLTSSQTAKTDVNINCGTNPAAWWLLAAGAGAAIAAADTGSPASTATP